MWPQAALAGAFAGAVAIAVTVAIERLGGRLGGLLGTLPTTIVPASLGILTAHPDPGPLREAMDATPFAMVVNAVFLWLWRALPPRLHGTLARRLALMVGLSLSAWFIGALTLVVGSQAALDAGVPTVALAVAGQAVLLSVGIAGARRTLPAPKGTRRVGPIALAARAGLAGVSIAAAVVISETAGGLAAGVASVFPAMFMTAMVALWLAQGEAVPSGAVGPMMVGSASVGSYALVARWALPALGPAAGAGLSWVVAVATTTLPAWWWLQRRARAGSAAS